MMAFFSVGVVHTYTNWIVSVVNLMVHGRGAVQFECETGVGFYVVEPTVNAGSTRGR